MDYFFQATLVPLIIAAMLSTSGTGRCTQRSSLDTGAIENLTGGKGALDQKEEVFKVSIPRNDLAVIVGGVKTSPARGLSSWAAFMRADKDDS